MIGGQLQTRSGLLRERPRWRDAPISTGSSFVPCGDGLRAVRPTASSSPTAIWHTTSGAGQLRRSSPGASCGPSPAERPVIRVTSMPSTPGPEPWCRRSTSAARRRIFPRRRPPTVSFSHPQGRRIRCLQGARRSSRSTGTTPCSGRGTTSWPATGDVFNFGGAGFYGSTRKRRSQCRRWSGWRARPTVGVTGWWRADGGVFNVRVTPPSSVGRGPDPQPTHRGYGSRHRTEAATGWWPPTAASSPSGCRVLRIDRGADPQQTHRGHGGDT